MTKHLFALISLSALVNCSFAQITDNTGKDLFVVKTTGGVSFPISSSGFSLSYTSPLNKEDTLEVTYNKYLSVKKEYDDQVKGGFATPRKVPFINMTETGTHYFMIIRRRAPNLFSYYAPQSVSQILQLFRPDLPANILKLVTDTLGSNGYTASHLIDSLVKEMNAKGTKVPPIYSVTDIGNGIRPFFLNFKVSNLSIKSFGQFFSNANQPTIQLELGAIQNTVLKFDNWDNLTDTKGLLSFYEYDLFYSIYVNTNCIDYVDTVNQKRTPYDWNSLFKFNQYGAKVNFNAYKSKHVTFAFTANGWYGLPLDNDKSFQLSKSVPILSNDTSFKVLGQAAGKYGGDVNSKLLNVRLSLAIPIFFDFSKEIQWLFRFAQDKGSKFYIMPSYAPFISTHSQWTHQVGLSLNLLAQPYGPPNSTIVQAGGFGFDLLSNRKAHTGWGSPLFYVSGTINLGSILTKTAPSKPTKL
jgi:hypothetical protein